MLPSSVQKTWINNDDGDDNDNDDDEGDEDDDHHDDGDDHDENSGLRKQNYKGKESRNNKFEKYHYFLPVHKEF